MARFSERDTTLIYQAAEGFRDGCLRKNGSLLFDSDQVWTSANLATLHQVFVKTPDEGDRSFMEKFKDQLKPAGQGVIRLGAEALAFYFLFPSNVGGRQKRKLVEEVLSWSNDKLSEDHLVARAFDTGIGSGGQGYNTRRPFELWFLIEFAVAWKKLDGDKMNSLLADPWSFEAFVDEIEGSDSRQIRHLLLHLFFPDQFERIASREHKRRIASTFVGLLQDPPEDLDRQLLAIRTELEKLYPKQQLDFYWPPLSYAWYDSAEGSDQFAPLELIHHKRQVVFYGPPGTGKSYRARSAAERVIRSSALRTWGASIYFQQQDRVVKAIKSNIHILQLHPAYSYEDFIRGLHLTSGRSIYRLGFLPKLIEKMNEESPEKRLPHVLILDEMNRSDLSRMLGECFSLLEYRGKPMILPGTDEDGKQLSLEMPADLYIMGTMNLIDQSVEQVDFALRRRFLWIPCFFDRLALLQVVEKQLTDVPIPHNSWSRMEKDFQRLGDAAESLNDAIQNSDYLGPQYQIGHTYFFDVVTFLRDDLQGAKARRSYLWRAGQPLAPIEKLWTLSLFPLLEQYLFGLRENERKEELKTLRDKFLYPPEAEE